MKVDLRFFKSLLGPQYQSDGLLYPLLCTHEAVELLRKWFDSAPQPFRETHVITFLRRCTDLSDARILNIFDILDWDQTGLALVWNPHALLCSGELIEPLCRPCEISGILFPCFAASIKGREADKALPLPAGKGRTPNASRGFAGA